MQIFLNVTVLCNLQIKSCNFSLDFIDKLIDNEHDYTWDTFEIKESRVNLPINNYVNHPQLTICDYKKKMMDF